MLVYFALAIVAIVVCEKIMNARARARDWDAMMSDPRWVELHRHLSE